MALPGKTAVMPTERDGGIRKRDGIARQGDGAQRSDPVWVQSLQESTAGMPIAVFSSTAKAKWMKRRRWARIFPKYGWKRPDGYGLRRKNRPLRHLFIQVLGGLDEKMPKGTAQEIGHKRQGEETGRQESPARGRTPEAARERSGAGAARERPGAEAGRRESRARGRVPRVVRRLPLYA